VPIDVRKEARAKPDRSRLREVAAEFELRQVVQRLDEEFLEDVPDRAVEETLVVEAEEGTPADLADGPISIAVAAGIWAASDGERVVTGDASDLVELAEQLRGRPLIAHDAKSQGGGGREGLLAVAPPGTLDLKHDTMVAAYLIDPARRVYELNELAADAGLAAAPTGAEPAQLSLAAEEGETAGDPTTEARLVIELASRQRSRLAEFGLERLLNDVEMPLIEVLAAIERAGVKLDAERRRDRGGMAGSPSSSEIFGWRGTSSRWLPQQLGEVCSPSSPDQETSRQDAVSTDARVLAQIRDEHEIVAGRDLARLTKLKNTYLDALPS
jgi:DNA polymerase-1